MKRRMDEQVRETIVKIDERITRPIPDMVINRIPKDTKEEFLAFAEKEYCNDYGMALKAVWQFYKGIALSGNERIEVSLTMLDERITALESMFKVQMKTEQPKDKVITSLGGNPLRTVRQ